MSSLTFKTLDLSQKREKKSAKKQMKKQTNQRIYNLVAFQELTALFLGWQATCCSFQISQWALSLKADEKLDFSTEDKTWKPQNLFWDFHIARALLHWGF